MRNNYLYALSGALPVDSERPNDVYSIGPFKTNGTAYDGRVKGGASLKFQIIK